MASKLGKEEIISLGFPMHDYSRSACERTIEAHEIARRFSEAVDARRWYHPPDWVIACLKKRVSELYQEMPVKVFIRAQIYTVEPYRCMEEMRQDVFQNGRLQMRWHKTGPITGALTTEWRAVHDYYGHVLQNAPFTMRGEIVAFAKHCTQFHPCCFPFIWNNVVAENVYRLVHGEFKCVVRQCPSPFVFDEFIFGCKQEEWEERWPLKEAA